MVKPKSQSHSKKTKSRGVDFKKYRRKIGRKLPPPKNATNTEIKSKAIVLPEQSIASEKAGLAVSKKGLTLKEILQQTSHHNAKVRKGLASLNQLLNSPMISNFLILLSDALLGIKDLLVTHPAELKLHKLAIIEKLRERIGDDDKVVRETLYQLFKSVIFPGCPKDNQGPLVSLLMAYIFNAMTHLAIEVRLMAFKIFELVLQFFPTSFTSYAEKVLQNYESILQKNQFLEDRGKLKSILAGLFRCLSLLPCKERDQSADTNDIPDHDILHAFEPEVSRDPIGLMDISKQLKDLLPILVSCFRDFMPMVHGTAQLDLQSCDCMQFILQSIDIIARFFVDGLSGSEHDPHIIMNQLISPMTLKKLWDVYPLNMVHHSSGKDDDRIFMLNTIITKIFLQLRNWVHSPSVLLDKFLEFIESALSTEIQSGKIFHERHLLPLIPYTPKLVMQISGGWRPRILQAFTVVFKSSNPASSMKLACILAIDEMLAPEKSSLYLDINDPTLLDYQITWIQDLPSLLILLDDKNPLCTKAVLRLLLCVGKTAPGNSPFSQEFDATQYSFINFFSRRVENDIFYGPFIKLAPDIQELAICCLCYFSFIDSLLLQSLISCCLCVDLQPFLVFRMLEVLQSAFRAGHIQFADYTSFLVTLLSRFKVYPENVRPAIKYDGKSNRKTFKQVTSIICTCLSQLGDDSLVMEMLEKIIVDHICGDTPMDNKCAFLRLLITLDSKSSRLSDQNLINISHVLPQYMINVVTNVGEDGQESSSDINIKRRRYYLLPCFHLVYGNKRLLSLVLNVMGSWVSDVSPSLVSNHIHTSVDRTNTICAITSVLFHMYKESRIRQTLLTCKTELETILQNLLNLLSTEGSNLTLEERHKIQKSYDQLRAIISNEALGSDLR